MRKVEIWVMDLNFLWLIIQVCYIGANPSFACCLSEKSESNKQEMEQCRGLNLQHVCRGNRGRLYVGDADSRDHFS